MQYGIMRALDPALGAPYATTLYMQIVGGEAYYNDPSEANLAALGINVIDEYPLALTAPYMYALSPAIYGYWVARPTPQWAIEEFAEFWIEAGNYQSYGPYTLKEWIHGESITVIANPFWPGTDTIPQPDIDEIYMVFVDQGTAQAMYEAGELDFLDTVPRTELDRIRADATLSQELIIDAGCSQYVGFNVRDEPTNNVHLRRALSYAIDRDAIVTVLGGIGDRPAQWFTLPEMAASPTLETHPDLGIWFDPELAQQELALYMEEMGYTSVDQIPPITLLYNTNALHAITMPVVQQSWADTLGIQAELSNQEFAVYLDQRENFPAWRGGWCFDVPDADNFLYEVFLSTSANNDNWYASEEFDSIVTQARQLSDVEERRALYAQAEELLIMTDVVVAPTYWSVTPHLVKPNVEYVGSLDNAEYYYLWTMTNP
jgi:oligopeptide transport system substrate-binding protein